MRDEIIAVAGSRCNYSLYPLMRRRKPCPKRIEVSGNPISLQAGTVWPSA